MFLPTCCPQNMRCCPVLQAYWKPNGNLASLSHLVVCDTILSTGISPIFKNGAPVREWCVFRGGFRKVSGKLRGTKWKSWWGIAEGLCRFVPVVMRPCGTLKVSVTMKAGHKPQGAEARRESCLHLSYFMLLHPPRGDQENNLARRAYA